MSNRLDPNRINAVIKDHNWRALVAFGAENVQYLTGAFLPFARARRNQPVAVVWPANGAPVAFVPAAWATSFGKASAVSVKAYDASGNDAAALAAAMGDTLKGGTIGCDLDAATAASIKALGDVTLAPADEALASLRMIKSDAEIALLSSAALRTDHAINGCIHHITVDRRMSELTFVEELRIHSVERDLDLIGYDATARIASGHELPEYWANAPRYGYATTRDLQLGETIRIDVTNVSDGYWSNAARMMVMRDQLSAEQEHDYDALVAVRELLLQHLKPGKTCAEVCAAVRKAAQEQGVPLVVGSDLGHGIGVSPVEAPFLNCGDDTPIAAGMVLVLDPVIETAAGICRSKDTVVIDDNGAKIVNWYKDWREPYTPIMSI